MVAGMKSAIRTLIEQAHSPILQRPAIPVFELPIDHDQRAQPKTKGELWVEVTYKDARRLRGTIPNRPLEWSFVNGFMLKVSMPTGNRSGYLIRQIGVPRYMVDLVTVLTVVGITRSFR
jgi:hypothetical protein